MCIQKKFEIPMHIKKAINNLMLALERDDNFIEAAGESGGRRR